MSGEVLRSVWMGLWIFCIATYTATLMLGLVNGGGLYEEVIRAVMVTYVVAVVGRIMLAAISAIKPSSSAETPLAASEMGEARPGPKLLDLYG